MFSIYGTYLTRIIPSKSATCIYDVRYQFSIFMNILGALHKFLEKTIIDMYLFNDLYSIGLITFMYIPVDLTMSTSILKQLVTVTTLSINTD